MGQIPDGVDGMTEWLHQHDEPYSTMIVEDYKITPYEANRNVGRDLMAVQVIGMLKGWAKSHNIKLEMQNRGVKRIGSLYGDYKHKGSHKDSHQWDAYYHGMYYLVKTGVRLPRGMGNGKKIQRAKRSEDK